MRQTKTNKREVGTPDPCSGMHPIRRAPRSTATGDCVCGRNEMLEAAEALDGTRLEYPTRSNGRTTSLVVGKRVCERDEMLEAAWKPEIGCSWNADMRSWTLDWSNQMFTLASKRMRGNVLRPKTARARPSHSATANTGIVIQTGRNETESSNQVFSRCPSC
jgi:hypothetical protein